jgi:class 3 adenylate cyclase
MAVSPWLQLVDDSLDVRMLMETGLAFAVLTGAPSGSDVRPAAMTVNNLRQGKVESETVVARARVLHSGPVFTLAEVVVEDGSGRGVAHGVATYVIYPIDPPPPPWAGSGAPVEPPVYPTPDPYLRPPDTAIYPAVFQERNFLSVCRDIVEGALPPFPVHDFLGARLVDISEGASTVVLRASEWLCARTREVSPGVIASLASYVLGGATASLSPLGYRFGSLDQTITFLAPVAPDDRDVVIRSRITHRRGNVVVCTAEMTDADGQVVAVAHQTSLLRPPRQGAAHGARSVRRIVTVLFSDIVKSTERAAELGDARWAELLDRHHIAVRKQLQLFKGTEVKTTGDGFLATFESPGQAIQAARAIRDGVRSLGLEIRVGIHTGECEVSKGDVVGIAVHIASRIQARADPGDILLSGTVHDLVAGSGLRFAGRGRHQLKGVDGEWPIFALDG